MATFTFFKYTFTTPLTLAIWQQQQPDKAAAEQSPSAAVDNPRRRCWHESSHTVVERTATCLVETQLDEASATDH